MEGGSMSAGAVIEGLLQVGATVKDAWTKAKGKDEKTTWKKFLASTEFDAAYKSVSTILKGLTQKTITAALQAVRDKEKALLAGKSVMDLSIEKLAQYDALLDVENQLMRKFAANVTKRDQWITWLIDDGLPVLIRVGKVVIPLLL